jgi:hypothetical protein
MVLPALERIHELSWCLQAAAHHDRLLSDDGQSILQQSRLVLDRRRSSRHVGSGRVYKWKVRFRFEAEVLLLPLRANPERLHWYGML